MRRLLLILSLLVQLASFAQAAGDVPAIAEPLPAIDLTGFTRIFDGKTLSNWDGDPTYWTVHDGQLVGTVTPETILKKNSWIVYRGALVRDFELVLDYRVSAQGNSGVGYRLAVLKDDPFSVRGPQADIEGGHRFTGICYEENGRRLLCARGQVTWIDPNQMPKVMIQFADPAELQSAVRHEDWNRYHLVVQGRHARHFLNGVLMSEVYDFDDKNRRHVGLIGVQVHIGPPMTIAFRDIFLKHLGDPPQGGTDRSDVAYARGSLRELNHRDSFDALGRQTLQFTAPKPEAPVGGRNDIHVKTRHLGVVRHDLVSVELAGSPRPFHVEPATYDLVLFCDGRFLRIPKAGDRYKGSPLSRDYHFHLRWNDTTKSYQAIPVGGASRPGGRGRENAQTD